ncbi:MAG: leucine--tRNA ligase [Thermoplasmatota archaeon]
MAWDGITDKWQQRWWDAGIHKADREGKEDKPSYFLHFAYPGISGYLHVGHMRGFTYGDVFTRYKRQTGHNVVYPAGFHASGIPAVAFAKEVERGEKTEYLRANGYDGDLAPLTDPENVVDYFANVYTHDYWKKFGFLIDERRNCTTIDPGYQKFIQWQFRRLKQKGWLVEKPHYAPFCPVAGPVAVDKSETDIKQGGSAEVKEFVALKFTIPAGDIVDTDDNFDAIVLPCATLRPETLFGVTNLWIHPEHEYELVRVWKDGAVADSDDSEVWLASQQGATKLEWQMERAERLGITVPGKTLVGETATAPFTEAQVPIVQATFVDPMIATGVVMSVPGHAPFDWAAYNDARLLESLGEPPQIVDIEGYDDLPARVAFEKFNVRDQDDKENLDLATDEVYSDEFNKGVLNDNCGPWAGQRIRAAKDAIRDDMVELDHGRLIRQFSEPVISRAGELVDIKRIPDQDFIHYADEAWTAATKEHAKSMAIYPQRYQDEFPNVLDWFGDRACVRRGAWLGTEFPFKDGWIIEPIADSTFYSWFYLISKYVQVPPGHAGTPDDDTDRPLTVDELTDALFDYVLNGVGEPANETWTQIREDILYWGPVDINLGGKEHQTVHFPVWTQNMVGLIDDPALWPKGIFVNWWVTQKAGTKISKSKGGAEPIPGAAAKYGVDPMRLYYCHVGSPHVDIEWDPDIVLTYRSHVERIQRITDDVLAVEGGAGAMDAWLESAFAKHIQTAAAGYEAYDLRGVAGELVYAVPETLRWYQRRGGQNHELLARIVRDWATALCPMLPHTAEEMFERAGGQGLCSVADFPKAGEVDEGALAAEDYLRAVLDDIKTIAKLADVESPESLTLFTTPAWKRDLTVKALEMAGDGKFPMGQFMGQVMQDPAMRELGKQVQAFTGKLPGQLNQFTPSQKAFLLGSVDEAEVLAAASDYIQVETGAKAVHVHPADGADAPADPKRSVAAPLKPGIALA